MCKQYISRSQHRGLITWLITWVGPTPLWHCYSELPGEGVAFGLQVSPSKVLKPCDISDAEPASDMQC